MTESGMFSGSGGTAGLLRAVGGWSNAAATHNRNTDLLKHEHMAVQVCPGKGIVLSLSLV